MQGSNGIVRAQNDTFYVTNTLAGTLSILERQSDDTLVIEDTIATGEHASVMVMITPQYILYVDRGLDNASMDSDGALWVAGKSVFR